MTDLIDRIRAYVAAIPTHYCMQRSREHACGENPRCPHCGAKINPIRFPRNSEADALLREVAALEPIGYACIAWGNVQKLVRRDDVAGEFVTSHEIYDTAAPEVRPLYTLTGATHE